MSDVVVANPGSMPWLPMMAAGLARARRLRLYVTPFGFHPTDPRRDGPPWLPRVLRHRVASELRRRELPNDVATNLVEHRTRVLEAASVVALRIDRRGIVAPTLARLRSGAFSRAVSHLLRQSDSTVVIPLGAAERTLKAANRLGVRSFLDCPNAHHAFAEKLLAEEARLQPAYAATLQFHQLPRTLKTQYEREIGEAHRIIVFSKFQRDTFVEEGVDQERLVVLNLGVDTKLFRPAERRANARFRVLFVGQATQRKGLSYLVRAFERAQIPDAELVIIGRRVGSGTPWGRLRNAVHAPHVPRWELPWQYQQADVFVLPSLVEGFPQTALEAMACGVPTIVSEHTFGDEVITDGESGFIVPIRDSEAIARRLIELYENETLRIAMGQGARRAAESFSWQAYGERAAELIAGAAAPQMLVRADIE